MILLSRLVSLGPFSEENLVSCVGCLCFRAILKGKKRSAVGLTRLLYSPLVLVTTLPVSTSMPTEVQSLLSSVSPETVQH